MTTTPAETMGAEMQRISESQVGYNEDYDTSLHELSRAMMAVRPDLPMMSLDEWVSEYYDQLTDLEKNAANAIVRLFDYELQSS